MKCHICDGNGCPTCNQTGSINQPPKPDLITLPAEERLEAVLAFTFRGIHHCGPIKKEKYSGGPVWSTGHNGLATWDWDELTRLVVAAHAYGVRAEIVQGGPRSVKIVLHARNTREGSSTERHPTLAEAVKDLEERL